MAQRLSHPEREGQVKGQSQHAPQKQTGVGACASTMQALALLLPGHGKCRSWLQASSTLVFCLQAFPDPPNFLSSKGNQGRVGTNLREGPGRLLRATPSMALENPEMVQCLQNKWY